jgi:hypothetical protein
MIILKQEDILSLVQSHLRHSKAIKCEVGDIHLDMQEGELTVKIYKEEPDLKE